jgi:hypothetical protein
MGKIVALFCLFLTFAVIFPVYAQASPDIPGIKAFAKAEVTIERLRKQKTPDWNAIAAQYEITAPIVKKIDAEKGLNYDVDIRDVLKKCSAGEKVKVNQQVLAKGLQHVAVLAITDELNAMKKSDTACQKVTAFFEGIRPTFTRRDKDFFNGKKHLEAAADNALKRLTDSKSDLAARREFEDTLARTYALCVLYEIIKVEKLRDSDLAACEVKVKEAEIFYRIIQPRIKKRSPKTNELITAMLSGSYSTMDAKALENYLNTGLAGITLR